MPKKTERGVIMTTPCPHNSKKSKPTQEELILRYLREHGSMTQLDAYEHLYGTVCTRLSGRILDLRRAGYDIETVYETNQYGTRYGRYILHEEAMS